MTRDKKWGQFTQWAPNFRAVIVCAKCGGTNIDHKPAGRLRCFLCQNEMHWSPDRFRVVRDIRELPQIETEAFINSTKMDFASAIDGTRELINREMRDDKDRFGDIVRSLEAFLDALPKTDLAGTSDGGASLAAIEMDFQDMVDKVKATFDTLKS